MPAIRKFDAEQGGEGFSDSVRSTGLLALGVLYFAVMLALLGITISVVSLLAVAMTRSGNPLLVGAMGAPVLAFGYAAYRSSWLRLPTPDGLRLHLEQAPLLWREFDGLRRTMGAGRIDGMVIDEEFRVAIVPGGRMGPRGGDKSYLVVGLPVLQALSKDEFRALLVRELWHFRASKRSGLHNLRTAWLRLHESLQDRDEFGLFIVKAFAATYTRLLDKADHACAGSCQIKADLAAAEVVGVDNVIEMLLDLTISDVFLREEVWPGIYKRADQQSDPPSTPYGEVAEALRLGPESDRAWQWINEALPRKDAASGIGLADRLSALGGEPHVPQSASESAADHFLDEAYPAVKSHLNRVWSEAIRRTWHDWHLYVSQAKERLEELPIGLAQQMTPAEVWQQACFVEEFQGAQEALPLYREFAAKHPNHAGVHFALGRILLAQHEGEGIGLMLKAINLDPEYALRGSELIYRFLRSRGKRPQESPLVARRGAELEWEGVRLALERQEIR